MKLKLILTIIALCLTAKCAKDQTWLYMRLDALQGGQACKNCVQKNPCNSTGEKQEGDKCTDPYGYYDVSIQNQEKITYKNDY